MFFFFPCNVWMCALVSLYTYYDVLSDVLFGWDGFVVLYSVLFISKKKANKWINEINILCLIGILAQRKSVFWKFLKVNWIVLILFSKFNVSVYIKTNWMHGEWSSGRMTAHKIEGVVRIRILKNSISVNYIYPWMWN